MKVVNSGAASATAARSNIRGAIAGYMPVTGWTSPQSTPKAAW